MQITSHFFRQIRLRTIVLVLLSSPFFAIVSKEPEGKVFQILLEKDDVLIVEKHQDIGITDDDGKKTREERNKIVLRAISRENQGTSLEGDFLTYSRTPAQTGEYKQDENFHAKFIIFRNGSYQVPSSSTMPNVQGLPGFPETPIKPSDTWKAPGLETMKLGIQKLSIPFQASYRYEGHGKYTDESGKEHQAEKISFTYSYDHRPAFVPRGAPVARVVAKSGDVMFFDPDLGIPVFDRQKILYTFYLTDGATVSYEYLIDSYWQKKRHATEETRENKAREIKAELDDKNVTVRSDQEGVILEMDDILFKTDSYELTPEARKTVAHIADLIKKHADREIRVLGHTDSRGKTDYNQTLSENRAKTVAGVLKSEHGIPGERLSFRGFGETKPIADNDTDTGRARNRRVEILIVME